MEELNVCLILSFINLILNLLSLILIFSILENQKIINSNIGYSFQSIIESLEILSKKFKKLRLFLQDTAKEKKEIE